MVRRTFRRKKGQKYNNTIVSIDGIEFDSKKESLRYLFLKEAEKGGLISNLERQVVYELIPPIKETYVKHLKTKDKVEERTLQRSITYRCDFQYLKGEELVVEDVKASPTLLPKEFSLKFKLMYWRYGIKVRLVYKPTEEI